MGRIWEEYGKNMGTQYIFLIGIAGLKSKNIPSNWKNMGTQYIFLIGIAGLKSKNIPSN